MDNSNVAFPMVFEAKQDKLGCESGVSAKLKKKIQNVRNP